VVRAAKQHAATVVDLLPIEAVFSEATIEKIRCLFLGRAVPDRSFFFPGRHQVSFFRIPAEGVEERALALFRLSCEATIEVEESG
jgi:hypothetical protein